MADERQRERHRVGFPHDGIQPVHEAGEPRVRLLRAPVLAVLLDRGGRARRQLLGDREVGGAVGLAVSARQGQHAHDAARADQRHHHRRAQAEAVSQAVAVLAADEPSTLDLGHLGQNFRLAAGQRLRQGGGNVRARQRSGLERAGEVLAGRVGVSDGHATEHAVIARHVDDAPIGQRPRDEPGEAGERRGLVDRRRQCPAGLGEQPGVLQRTLGLRTRLLLALELLGPFALAPVDFGHVAQHQRAQGAAGHVHPRDRRLELELRAVAAEAHGAVGTGGRDRA